MSTSANLRSMQQLRSGDLVVICADCEPFRSAVQICSEFRLKPIFVEPRSEGHADLEALQSRLYRDRMGDIKAVLVSAAAATAVQDVIDLAWHDAFVIVDTTLARAA